MQQQEEEEKLESEMKEESSIHHEQFENEIISSPFQLIEPLNIELETSQQHSKQWTPREPMRLETRELIKDYNPSQEQLSVSHLDNTNLFEAKDDL